MIEASCSDIIANLSAPELLNGCSTDEIIYDETTVAMGCAGGYLRTWAAVRSGNVVASFQQFVTITDTEAPQIFCPSDITLVAPNGITSLIVDYDVTANDDCGAVTFEYSHNSGSSFPICTTQVTVVAADNCENQASRTFTITISSEGGTTYYQDSDNDNYGNPAVLVISPNPPS